MCDISDFFILQNIIFRIADALYINQPGIVLDRLGKIFGSSRVDKCHLDTQLFESMAKQRSCPAIKRT